MLFQELGKLKRSSIMTSIILMAVGIMMVICPPQYIDTLVSALGYGMVTLAAVMIMDFLSSRKVLMNYIYLTGIKKVMESQKYRPFNDTTEFIVEYETRIGNNKNPPNTMPLIWVKHKDSETVELITAFCKDGVEMGGTYMTWGFFFDAIVFLDKSPCGVEIKEEVE